MLRRLKIKGPVAHISGPGKLKIVNTHLTFKPAWDEERTLVLDAQALMVLLLYGHVQVTSEAFQRLAANDVHVAKMDPQGRRCDWLMQRPHAERTALRLRQYRALHDEGLAQGWARQLVEKKLTSQGTAALHYQKHGAPEAGGVRATLRQLYPQCKTATMEQLRGIEGAGSAAWFTLFGSLLQPPWTFVTRERPAQGPVNALLNLGYMLLFHRMRATVECLGLESYLGALHRFRAGRASLVCDLIEPLRVTAVDRWVLAILNQGEVQMEWFEMEHGRMQMQQTPFLRTVASWEKHYIEKNQDEAVQQQALEFVQWVETNDPWNAEEKNSGENAEEGLADWE
jgi:CRISPR-associated protein Cas1